MKTKIRIAIQKKGRLKDESLEFLRQLGLKFPDNRLLTAYKNVELLKVRCSDIPTYIEQGAADFGIIGENQLIEKPATVTIIKKLDFGRCSLVIAAPKIKDLEGERIATSYPRTLKKFLREKGIAASVIEIRGSVEVTPALGLADAICDITQSGNTLRENGLKIQSKILDSQAILIGKSSQLWKSIITQK